MADDDFCFGYELLDAVGGGLDVVDTVVDEVDLAFTREFPLDGALDALFVEGDDFGDDGAAVEWCGGE